MESLPNETKMTNHDYPSFSLGVEFEMSGKEKDVEVPLSKTEMAVHESDKIVEKSGKEFENSDKEVEESNKALESNKGLEMIIYQNVASPYVEAGFQVLENEVEIKDEVWQKVVEITDAIQAETEFEEKNVDAILIDDEDTPNVPLKRQKKPAALLQSPWVNEYDSTARTIKRVVKGTYAFPVGLGPHTRDVDAFELWYNKGLVKKNK